MDEFQLCHRCILKDKYSDIDILCCHSAGGDILIKSPDSFFHSVISCQLKMNGKALILILCLKLIREKHSCSF